MYTERIRELARQKTNDLIDIRRWFHMYPETDFDVKETALQICTILEKSGIKGQITPCNGVTALLTGNCEGPTVALRADMDALPVTEKNSVPYKSRNIGKMHACGHDAHMAIILGLAEILSSMREDLRGNIKFIFQPAEETTGGAEIMISEGVLEDPYVDAVFSLHVTPDIPAGMVGCKAGRMRAAADMFDIKVKGFSSHGAEPEKGTDAIVISNRIISIIQQLVSRRVSPLDSAVITIGTISGGSARNIIADEVSFSGIIRTLEPLNRPFLRAELEKIISITAESMGGTGEVEFTEGYPALLNDPEMTLLVSSAAAEYLGVSSVVQLDSPSMGVDDFSYFLQKRPGCYFMLGTGFNDKKNFPLHHSCFDIDEKVIPDASGMLAQLCFNYLNKSPGGEEAFLNRRNL